MEGKVVWLWRAGKRIRRERRVTALLEVFQKHFKVMISTSAF